MGSLHSSFTLSPKNQSIIYKEFISKINSRHLMTAKELMEIDDICTTLVVDPLLRIKSHKVLLDYKPPSIQTHLIALSIMLQYINDGDILKVYRSLFSLQITKKFLSGRSLIFRQHFRDHLLRFIAMFYNDSGFVISDCSRYGHENYVGAKLISTKYWRKGDTIEMLIGVIADLTVEEERELLVTNKNDFSVLMSQRRKIQQLWLGPGSFLNHNCQPNCEFSTKKSNAGRIIVLHDVKPGDELFINYGPEFFGENNCECECQTCEKNGMGHFQKDKSKTFRKCTISPATSICARNENDEFIRKKRISRSSMKKEPTPEELIFNKKEFFQNEIYKRFINYPLITGNENVKKSRYQFLQSLKFHGTNSPIIETEKNPSLKLMFKEFTGWDNELNPKESIEKNIPKLPMNYEKHQTFNYLSSLNLNVYISKTSNSMKFMQNRIQWKSNVKTRNSSKINGKKLQSILKKSSIRKVLKRQN